MLHVRMEVPYLIAGKRFKAESVSALNEQLKQYGLVSNLESDGCGDFSVRRLSDTEHTCRYAMLQSHGDDADTDGYDLCIGQEPGGPCSDDLLEVELSELEKVLAGVRQDIPDAKLLFGSYWR